MSLAEPQTPNGAMPQITGHVNRSATIAAPPVREPIIVEPEVGETTSNWGAEFWGQLLPIAIVLAIIAATVTMSAPPINEVPAPASEPAPEAFSLDPNDGLSHEQLDQSATPNFEDILAEMPDEPAP